MISPHSSTKADARTMVQGVPAAWRCSSAARFARNNSIGLSAAAPTTDINTTSAPTRAAASTSVALPSRSIDAGVT